MPPAPPLPPLRPHPGAAASIGYPPPVYPLVQAPQLVQQQQAGGMPPSLAPAQGSLPLPHGVTQLSDGRFVAQHVLQVQVGILGL